MNSPIYRFASYHIIVVGDSHREGSVGSGVSSGGVVGNSGGRGVAALGGGSTSGCPSTVTTTVTGGGLTVTLTVIGGGCMHPKIRPEIKNVNTIRFRRISPPICHLFFP
jgi:hypothetical protein